MASFGTFALLLAFGLLAGPAGGYAFDDMRGLIRADWLPALVLVLALLAISSTSATLILAHVNPGRRFEPPSPEVQRRLLETVLIGGAVYSAVFAALGGMLKHSIIFGLAYTFVVEGFLANLPGGNQKITIVYYLRSFLVGADPSIRSQLGEALTNTPLVPAGRALATLVGILFGALLLGGLVVRRKQYVLPS